MTTPMTTISKPSVAANVFIDLQLFSWLVHSFVCIFIRPCLCVCEFMCVSAIRCEKKYIWQSERWPKTRKMSRLSSTRFYPKFNPILKMFLHEALAWHNWVNLFRKERKQIKIYSNFQVLSVFNIEKKANKLSFKSGEHIINFNATNEKRTVRRIIWSVYRFNAIDVRQFIRYGMKIHRKRILNGSVQKENKKNEPKKNEEKIMLNISSMLSLLWRAQKKNSTNKKLLVPQFWSVFRFLCFVDLMRALNSFETHT